MRAYVNELALAEACAAASPEEAPLLALLEGRHRHAVLASALFCARAMPATSVREGLSLRDLGQRLPRAPDRFTFPDPAGPGTLTCFWHGKIRSEALRMHFEWPPADPTGPLRVVYIGPHR